jgi:GNAT superfamily N-acetyltransferase
MCSLGTLAARFNQVFSMQFIGVHHTHCATALAKLINCAYRGGDGLGRWTTEQGFIAGERISVEGITDLILARNVRVFAAFDNNDLPRCCIAIHIDNTCAEFSAFAVRPEEQGCGLGTLLLNFAEQYAAKHRQVLRVCVLNKSHNLINFYLRRGYSLCEQAKPYPADQLVGTPLVEGLALLTMEKPAPHI